MPSAGHPIERLTKRQREVLRLMAQGLANKEIATELGISTETARTHAAAILAGLGAENRTEATATYLRWSPRLDRAEVVLARPAIAVLPIPATGAKAAPLLAQAIARELTSLLSRWCHFPVIAHAATRDPRGLGDTTAEIGARLGARFLVDGALTCWRQRWRLTMHVVDASTSRLVWTEHLDLTPRRWFATQDQVCARLVASAYPRLIAAVHPPLASDSPGDLPAWQLTHVGFALHESRDRNANQRAHDTFTAAIARDPTSSLAHYGRGLSAYDALLNQWAPAGPALDRLAADADRCLTLAPDRAEGHFLAARHLQARGKHDRAPPLLRSAIAANPSFAPAYALLGQTLLLTGLPDEGLTRMRQACRLDPRSFVTGLAVAHFARREYRETIDAVTAAIAVNPRYPFARALAAAATWLAGDRVAARRHASDLVALAPRFSPREFARTFGEHVDAVHRLTSALTRALGRPARVSAASGSSSAGRGSTATAR